MLENINQNLVSWGKTTVYNAPLAMFVNSIIGALMLQDIHSMISSRNMSVHADQYDRFWVQVSMKEWHLLYPMKSVSSLKHTLEKMAEQGILHMERIGSKRSAPYFTIDYDMLKEHDEEMVRRMFDEGCDVPNEKLVEYGIAHEGCGANIIVSWEGKKGKTEPKKNKKSDPETLFTFGSCDDSATNTCDESQNDAGITSKDDREKGQSDVQEISRAEEERPSESQVEPLINFKSVHSESLMDFKNVSAEPVIDFANTKTESVMNLAKKPIAKDSVNIAPAVPDGAPVEYEPINRPQKVLNDVLLYYENNVHPFVSLEERDELTFFANTNPVALVKHAIDVAVKKHIQMPMKYIRGIINNESDKAKWATLSEQGKKQFAEKVWMTDEEYQKLVEFYGNDKELTDSRINALNHYKLAHAKEYASDYNAILIWEDKKKQREQAFAKKNPTYAEMEKRRKEETPEEREKREKEEEAKREREEREHQEWLKKIDEDCDKQFQKEEAERAKRKAQREKEREEMIQREREKTMAMVEAAGF